MDTIKNTINNQNRKENYKTYPLDIIVSGVVLFLYNNGGTFMTKYEEQIKEILENNIGDDVEVGIDLVDKNKNVAICFFKANGYSFPLTATPIKDKKKLNDVAVRLEKEALKMLKEPKQLKIVIDKYYEEIEKDVLDADESIINADESFEDLRDIETKSDRVDDPEFGFDEGSAYRNIDLDDVKDVYGEE